MAAESLAIDVVRDPGTELGASLDRYAGAFSARFGRLGVVSSLARPSLLGRLERRWSPGALTSGLIEVYDGADFGSLVRDWTLRAGYEGDEYKAENPFVIPVDPAEPTADVGGLRAARRPDRRAALQPVAVRQAPATTPRPREQWRPAGQRTLSPYPPALGNAGAVQAHLLRFPDARAEVGTGERRALVEDASEARILPWAPPGTVGEAGRAAEVFEARLTEGRAPAPVVPIAAWLVPQNRQNTKDSVGLADRPRAVAGRWLNAAAGPALALVARSEELAPGAPGALAALAESQSVQLDVRTMALAGDAAETALVMPRADAAPAAEGPTRRVTPTERPEPPRPTASRADSPRDVPPADRAPNFPNTIDFSPGRPVAPTADTRANRTVVRPLAVSEFVTSAERVEGRPASPIARILARAAAAEALPWRSRPEASPAPFVPAGLAGVAMALGQAFDEAAPSRVSAGWSALADGRTLVLPAAAAAMEASRPAARVLPTAAAEAVRTRRAPIPTASPPATLSGAPPEPGRPGQSAPPPVAPLFVPPAIARIPSVFAEAARLPGARMAAAEAVERLPAAERILPADPVRALMRGLDLLGETPSFMRPAPMVAEQPALARPFALAAHLPETHRELPPATTVAPPTFGERLAAFAARAEVDLGLTVASSPAGSLDAPWFAHDLGTLLVPLPAPRAATRGEAVASETTQPSIPVPARPPGGLIITLPPLAVAVQAARAIGPSPTPAAPSPAALGSSPIADAISGAVQPMSAGPLDATYVVPAIARAAVPIAALSGSERAARFAEQVTGGRAATPPAPQSALPARSGARPEPATAGSTTTQPTRAPLHPALAALSPSAAAPAPLPPTLGERLAATALVAFQAATRPAIGTSTTEETERPTAPRWNALAEAGEGRGTLIVPAAETRTPSREAGRVAAEAAIQPVAAPRPDAARPEPGPSAAVPRARAETPVVSQGSAQRLPEAATESVFGTRAVARAAQDLPSSAPTRSPATAAQPPQLPPAVTAALEALAPAVRLMLLREPTQFLDISAPAERTEVFVRWLTGEATAPAGLAARLEAAGVLAPGAQVRPEWQGALADPGVLVSPELAETIAESAPAARRGRVRTEAATAAPDAPLVSTPTSRLNITAWPATVQRLLEVWRLAETALEARRPAATPRIESDFSPEILRTSEAAGWAETPNAARPGGVLVQSAAPSPETRSAAPAAQLRLPGSTALAAAGLGTRLATRRFEELLAAPPAARPMISRPAFTEPLQARPVVARPELGAREALVQAGMISAGDPETFVESSTSGYSAADIMATEAVWPALVAAAVGVDAALGAGEEWAGSAAPGGRIAGPLNFERALLTWSAAAVRDAQSKVAEERPGRALGPLGQLVRQNAVTMGPRTVDVAMRAATGGNLFGDRGPGGLTSPDVHARRVLVDPGARAAEQALRSTPGERPTREGETNEEAQHRLSEQVGEEVSPEETERLAREIISRLKRELEFDAARMGDDAWD